MKIHELKTWPQYFHAIKEGIKTFEVRKADRDFNVGDILLLREFIPCKTCNGSGRQWDNGDKINCFDCNDDNGEYTGQTQKVKVTYITDFGQPQGQIVMSIIPAKD